MRARATAVAISVALASTTFAACSSGDGDALTVYSGRNEELIEPLIADFEDETGIDVEVRYGDSADLALLIDTEGDNAPADVFLSQSPGAIGYLDGKNRLQPIPDDVLDLVQERFRADDGKWAGLSGRVRVLVYNTDLVDEADLPESVFELTDPKYRGKVALSPTNGSFQDFVTAMREIEGNERTQAWLEGMEANDARAYANNLAIVEAVGRGEIPLGLVNHYYLERARAEDPDIPAENYFFPGGDVGSLILVTAVGVLDTADDPADAERLLEFMLTNDAQRYFADETFEYPLAHGVEPPAALRDLESVESPPINLSSLGGGLEETRRLIAESGLEQS
jgi:iron(III) transport system substrate-binding protein